MAVSAFKSTTRRRGIQGTPATDQESSGRSRTLSDHLTTHHHKLKYHRRSSSYTDLSPYSRHSGDSPRFRAIHAPRFLDRQLSERDLGKNKPIEDVECTASVSKHANEVIQGDNGMRHTLQRSISAHDKNYREHPEGQVEEKIIRAVHAQNKPKRLDSLSRDQSELYNIIKAEVFDVVADMKDAIENSQEKALMFDCSACESADKSNTSFSEEIVKVFRYVCKGYAAKIDKVEEEVKQLRSQLAEKEKVCLDLTSFINELIPESGAVQRPQGPKPLKQDNGRRKIFKYVSEQEKGASLPPARSGSILDDDACVERLSSEQILLELEKEAQQGRWSRLQSGSTMGFEENKDGLVLPWLQWEEANVQCHSSRKIVKHKQECTLQDSLQEEVERKFEHDEERVANGMQGTHQRKDDYDTMLKPRYTTSSSIKSSHVEDSSLLYIQSAELISERIQFRARVDAGELLLCIGTLHIF